MQETHGGLNNCLIKLTIGVLIIFQFNPFNVLAQGKLEYTDKQTCNQDICELPFYYPKKLYFGNGSSIMTPTGFGASNYTIFAAGGIAFREVYMSEPDGAESFGIGLGSPYRNIGIVMVVRINDISEQDNLTFGFKLHKYLGRGTSIAIGGTHLFYTDQADGNESYYFVVSHTFQNLPSVYPGRSLLTYNCGIGNGKFLKKSPMDISKGKGKYGTAVFASVAYGLFKNSSLIIEWSGLNLNSGFSIRPFNKFPFSFTIGLVDLTPNSGDGVRMVCSCSIWYSIFKDK